REVDFPAQAQVQGELGSYAPGVLAVEEPSLLALGGVGRAWKIRGVDVACERGNLSQQERCKVQTAIPAVRCSLGTEVVFSRAVVVAGDAQVHGVTDVATELNLVIAFQLGPIVDELELLFAFGERTIATCHTQAVSKAGNYAALAAVVLSATLAADRIWAEQKRPQAGRLGIRCVRVRNPEVAHRRAPSGLLGLWVVFEPTEAEIGQ